MAERETAQAAVHAELEQQVQDAAAAEQRVRDVEAATEERMRDAEQRIRDAEATAEEEKAALRAQLVASQSERRMTLDLNTAAPTQRRSVTEESQRLNAAIAAKEDADRLRQLKLQRTQSGHLRDGELDEVARIESHTSRGSVRRSLLGDEHEHIRSIDHDTQELRRFSRLHETEESAERQQQQHREAQRRLAEFDEIIGANLENRAERVQQLVQERGELQAEVERLQAREGELQSAQETEATQNQRLREEYQQQQSERSAYQSAQGKGGGAGLHQPAGGGDAELGSEGAAADGELQQWRDQHASLAAQLRSLLASVSTDGGASVSDPIEIGEVPHVSGARQSGDSASADSAGVGGARQDGSDADGNGKGDTGARGGDDRGTESGAVLGDLQSLVNQLRDKLMERNRHLESHKTAAEQRKREAEQHKADADGHKAELEGARQGHADELAAKDTQHKTGLEKHKADAASAAVQSKDAEIEALREEVARLRGGADGAATASADPMPGRESADGDARQDRAENETLRARIAELEAAVASANAAVASANAERDALAEQLRQSGAEAKPKVGKGRGSVGLGRGSVVGASRTADAAVQAEPRPTREAAVQTDEAELAAAERAERKRENAELVLRLTSIDSKVGAVEGKVSGLDRKVVALESRPSSSRDPFVPPTLPRHKSDSGVSDVLPGVPALGVPATSGVRAVPLAESKKDHAAKDKSDAEVVADDSVAGIAAAVSAALSAGGRTVSNLESGGMTEVPTDTEVRWIATGVMEDRLSEGGVIHHHGVDGVAPKDEVAVEAEWVTDAKSEFVRPEAAQGSQGQHSTSDIVVPTVAGVDIDVHNVYNEDLMHGGEFRADSIDAAFQGSDNIDRAGGESSGSVGGGGVSQDQGVDRDTAVVMLAAVMLVVTILGAVKAYAVRRLIGKKKDVNPMNDTKKRMYLRKSLRRKSCD